MELRLVPLILEMCQPYPAIAEMTSRPFFDGMMVLPLLLTAHGSKSKRN